MLIPIYIESTLSQCLSISYLDPVLLLVVPTPLSLSPALDSSTETLTSLRVDLGLVDAPLDATLS